MSLLARQSLRFEFGPRLPSSPTMLTAPLVTTVHCRSCCQRGSPGMPMARAARGASPACCSRWAGARPLRVPPAPGIASWIRSRQGCVRQGRDDVLRSMARTSEPPALPACQPAGPCCGRCTRAGHFPGPTHLPPWAPCCAAQGPGQKPQRQRGHSCRGARPVWGRAAGAAQAAHAVWAGQPAQRGGHAGGHAGSRANASVSRCSRASGRRRSSSAGQQQRRSGGWRKPA